VKLHIITAALPPKLDGIGDHTALLAAQLARQADVTILSGQESETTPIAGVRIVPAFSAVASDGVRALLAHVRTDRPDWLLLQYNPFSYGKYGFNPYLPLVMRAIRRQLPDTRIAVMFHEAYTPLISLKFAVMTTWQRGQVYMLGRAAHRLYFSMEAWARQIGRWFPGKPAFLLPVGSNIPRLDIGVQEARARLGIGPQQVVLGLFGTAHPSRMLPLMRQTGEAVLREGHDAVLLYIGPDHDALKSAVGDLPLRSDGALAADEVSRRFAAMDVYLAAFVDGISTRRGSMMTGLQHGIPTVGTTGINTDSVLSAQEGKAYLLAHVDAPDLFVAHTLRLLREPNLRRQIGAEGQCLYDREFDWKPIAARLLSTLGAN
jgi:glycosyltransferase involved in cell wall biosynthesis